MVFIFFTAGGKRIHEPSRYRALVREMKSEKARPPQDLIHEARQLKDPYYTSLALFSLSADPRLSLQEAYDIALDAVRAACDVPRLWRRAELLTTLARKMKSWRGDGAAEKREHLMDALLESVVAMPDGKDLSDAIAGCVSRLGCSRVKPLLERALSNTGFEDAGAKAVIRRWVHHCGSPEAVQGDIMTVLNAVDNRAVRSKLMGYLHLQLRRTGAILRDDRTPLHDAVSEALSINDGEQQMETFRYLAKTVSAADDVRILKNAVDNLESLSSRAKIITALAGSADRAELRELAITLFTEALRTSAEVENQRERALIRMNAALGLARCQQMELAQRAYRAALDDCGENARLRNRICRSMEEHGLLPPEECDAVPRNRPHEKTADDVRAIRHMLALYNTYEGGITPVHLRAIARAAPLCIAFGMDLVLIGFPIDDTDKLVAYVTGDTNIGRGGKYLEELVRQGRVVLAARTVPELWDTLGMPVATTSHPEEEKKIVMSEAIRLARLHHPLQRACIIMGLGKKGLPHLLLKEIPHHLELTGKNVSLETCTAMGVIAQQVHDAQMLADGKSG